MLPKKYIAGAGAITSTVVMLTLAISLADRNHVSDRDDSPSFVQNGSLAPSLSDKERVVREELASLTTHVEVLQQQLASLRQAESRAGENPGNLHEQVLSLKDELAALAGRIDTDRSNTLDYRDTADSVLHAPDATELAYAAQQQHDLAESEFQEQEFDSQWAVATADQVYNLLTTEQDAMFPGEDMDLTSLVDTLECRASTCRVEIKATSEEQMEALQLQLLASTSGLFSSGTFHQTDSGNIIVYMHSNSQ